MKIKDHGHADGREIDVTITDKPGRFMLTVDIAESESERRFVVLAIEMDELESAIDRDGLVNWDLLKQDDQIALRDGHGPEYFETVVGKDRNGRLVTCDPAGALQRYSDPTEAWVMWEPPSVACHHSWTRFSRNEQQCDNCHVVRDERVQLVRADARPCRHEWTLGSAGASHCTKCGVNR